MMHEPCTLSFRAPYRQQTDSAVEKSTEGISSSIPLSVITNLSVSSTANGVATANSYSTTGTESSTGDARDRRRLVDLLVNDLKSSWHSFSLPSLGMFNNNKSFIYLVLEMGKKVLLDYFSQKLYQIAFWLY